VVPALRDSRAALVRRRTPVVAYARYTTCDEALEESNQMSNEGYESTKTPDVVDGADEAGDL
jgi:hypothetical protein